MFARTDKPRVLLLHNFLSPYRVPLFNALAERFDLDVWILGDIRTVREWSADAAGATFRLRTLPNLTIPLGSRYNAILLNYSLPVALARQRTDVIVCCAWDTPATFYTALHARATRTPFILWSGSTPAEQTFLRTATKPAVRALVRSAAAWLAYGTRAKAYLVSLGAVPERTYLAYNTVDTAAFADACAASADATDRLRGRYGIVTPRVVLYCGNLLDLKGVPDLLDAFAILARQRDDVTLLLVGGGEGRSRYERKVSAMNLADRVRFAGFVPRDQMPMHYALADLLVAPSRTEVWGLVINEALACGVPVLATDICGAAADLLHDGENGYAVPARDPQALAKRIAEHFAHSERHASMRDAARRSIEPFTIERTADAFVDAVNAVVRKNP